MKKPVRVYYYRGLIESGGPQGGYRWLRGYSAAGEGGGVLYPWLGKRACQAQAKRDGVRAVFAEVAS